MKVAVVHDYLNQYGGAERVLETLAEIFPEADFYTLFYDEEKTFGRFSSLNVKTSFLDYFPFVKNNHRVFIPLLPLAASSVNLGSRYDLVVSATAGYAKGVRCGGGFHVSYCHTPLRYAWETDYISAKLGNLDFKPAVRLLKPAIFWLRRWDLKTSKNPDVIIANSEFVAGKIRKYYGRDADVVYPPVDLKTFYPDPAVKTRSYFLALGRLLHYKKFDLVVEAFNKLNLPLKIVGGGPELKKLKKAAKSEKIEFLSFVRDENELRRIYSGARAFLFPQVEDFGLTAAEAIACGAPVIAYRGGGALEIVKDGVSGAFFGEQNPSVLAAAVEEFLKRKFNSEKVSREAERFSKERFKREFLKVVNRYLKTNENFSRRSTA